MFKTVLSTVVAVLLVIVIVIGVIVYSGAFDVAADVPHSAATIALLDAVRTRSIAVRARDVKVPKLDDPQLVLLGAGHYSEMCVECHLAPGNKDSELRQGLNPLSPDLTEVKVEPAAGFWIIKHGLKMTGMPAWGPTHDDHAIWAMVAFLQKLPGMTPAEYQALVAKAPKEDEMEGAHPTPAPGGGEPQKK